MKQSKWSKYSGSSKLLFPTYYCVEHIIVSSNLLCPHFLLLYTWSKFPCQHAAVISRFTLSSPLLHNIFTHGRWWRHAIPISVTSSHPLTSRTSRLFLNIWSLDMQKSSIYLQFDKLRNFSSWISSVNRRTNYVNLC